MDAVIILNKEQNIFSTKLATEGRPYRRLTFINLHPVINL
jgi:hypothetical protein